MVKSHIEKVEKDIAESSCDPLLITCMNALCESVKLLADNQAVIVTAVASNNHNSSSATSNAWIPVTRPSNSYSAALNAKKSRTEPTPRDAIVMTD
jgi:hypothetical protein